jgi:hypothetical protein
MEDRMEILHFTKTRQIVSVEEHRKRHEELHTAIDELLSDFIAHNRDATFKVLDLHIGDLVRWSFEQSREHQPTPLENTIEQGTLL